MRPRRLPGLRPRSVPGLRPGSVPWLRPRRLSWRRPRPLPWLRPRIILAACAVAIIALVTGVAVAVGPEAHQGWLLLSAVVAVAMAVQSVVSDPADLAPALLLSLPPVIALVAEGSPTWLIGPLAALLLLAGELNALSWKTEIEGPFTAVHRRRLLSVGRLVALGFAAAVAVGLIAGVR